MPLSEEQERGPHTDVCAICNGPIYLSTVGSGFDRPVYVHARDEDWVRSPHDAVPFSSETDPPGSFSDPGGQPPDPLGTSERPGLPDPPPAGADDVDRP